MSWGYGWKPYVPVWKRREQAAKKMEKLRKKGLNVQPVRIEGRQIAQTFWGRAWCEHLEKFSDFENRLPRGRTYVRNGSVCHLDIQKGIVIAKVSGSELYEVKVKIKALPDEKWKAVKTSCAGQVGSLIELLQGKLSSHVMTTVTDKEKGLFPLPKEIELDCSCPDWADMCKHVAAVLYGVGARLDDKPELLFLLRGVEHTELVGETTAKAIVSKAKDGRRTLDEKKLGEVFGIELAAGKPAAAEAKRDAQTEPLSAAPARARPRPAKGKGKAKIPAQEGAA